MIKNEENREKLFYKLRDRVPVGYKNLVKNLELIFTIVLFEYS